MKVPLLAACLFVLISSLIAVFVGRRRTDWRFRARTIIGLIFFYLLLGALLLWLHPNSPLRR